MRFIFALMDSDGDGTVSLQEFQAAHEKIFKATAVRCRRRRSDPPPSFSRRSVAPRDLP
jgi:hypothetical protein